VNTIKCHSYAGVFVGVVGVVVPSSFPHFPTKTDVPLFYYTPDKETTFRDIQKIKRRGVNNRQQQQ